MKNPFDAIYEKHDAHDAAVIAEAFCTADNTDEMYAILRFACARDGKSGGYYQAYLEGKAFTQWQGYDGMFNDACFDDVRELAQSYREECHPHHQFYKLSI